MLFTGTAHPGPLHRSSWAYLDEEHLPLLFDVLVYVIRFPFLFCNERRQTSEGWGRQWERDPGQWLRMGTQLVSGEPVSCSWCSAVLQGPGYYRNCGRMSPVSSGRI